MGNLAASAALLGMLGLGSSARGDIGAGALRFDGAAGATSSGFPTDLPVDSDPYTIEVWFKTSTNGTMGLIGWGGYGDGVTCATTPHNTIALRTANADGFNHYWWYEDHLVGGLPAHNDDTYHHVAVTYDGLERNLYFDGGLVDTLSGTRTDPVASGSFTVGYTGRPPCFSEPFVGDIAEVRVWGIARSEVQINGNMNVDLTGSEAGLVALYEFEDGPGSPTAADEAGLAFPLDVVGSNAIVATGVSPSSAIPTLSEWGMIALFGVLAGAMGMRLRKGSQIA